MILYYEQIAADIVGINPEKMFENVRTESVVLARQFCMIYRKKVLHMSLAVSAERYHLDHATVIHAIKSMENYEFQKHERFTLYQQFINTCSHRLSSFDNLFPLNGDLQQSVDAAIKKHGFKRFIADSANAFNKMFVMMQDEVDENDIKSMLDTCHVRIHELKYLYE